jgi:hypothetical protein
MAQTLPIVPFGKYKGEPITTLLNDTKYLEWCKDQEWFQKFPIVYNICVNQTLTTTNQGSKTPEHNKLQNLFLKSNIFNIEKLLRHYYNKTHKNLKIYDDGTITFEGMFNWDLIVEDYAWDLCDCVWSDEKNTCDCEINKNFRKKNNIHEDSTFHCLRFDELYCEIKPLLGDDYPCVLRKMKTQIELTNNYAEKSNKKFIEEQKQERYTTYRRQPLADFNYDTNYCLKRPNYALIIKDFISSKTTKAQLIEIFGQADIKVIFIGDLFDEIQSLTTAEPPVLQLPKSGQPQSIEQNPLEAEIKNLKEKLLQAEEKIKQLEQENTVLKTQKQTKSIKDYFGKK